MTYVCSVARNLGSDWRHRQRVRLHEKQAGLCYWCKKKCTIFGARKKKMTIDHVTPVCLGGSHDEANLVGACDACNNRRGKQAKKKLKVLQSIAEKKEEHGTFNQLANNLC